jgi:catechol 2,3-dioxygenase-like lactoylglutathione lyase family enzyme
MIASAKTETARAIQFLHTVPILRIFDIEKAKDFYCGFLGFKVDWEHRFEPGLPLYMQVSRDGLRLHLSEHHGDGSPGIHVCIEMTGVEELHREVTAKGYHFMNPGLQDEFYGARAMHVIDPFGNRISFIEYNHQREG